MFAAVESAADVWRFRPHPEVWLLVGSIVAAYWYAITRIGPRVVRRGEVVVTRRQLWCFGIATAMLWVGSDWPIHDVGEQNLYFVHMLQHMMFSYFMPPLFLLAIPTWLARLLVGNGRAYSVVRWLAKPIVAGVVFNVFVMVTHIPAVVNHSVLEGTGALHYGLHTVLVLTALLMWMPVVSPLPELRIGVGGQMIYLFAMSIVPTVPASWLVFAEGAVYSAYDHGPRVWGIDVTSDQQIAGLVMKVGGSVFLWTIVTVMFFTRFSKGWNDSNSYKRPRMPDAEITGHDEGPPLTYDDVTKAFDEVPVPPGG